MPFQIAVGCNIRKSPFVDRQRSLRYPFAGVQAVNNMILLGVLALLVCTARADADRVFDIDTYLALKSINGISVSPDGAFLAYNESKNDLENDTSLSAVWMQATAGGEPVRMSAVGSAAWSPKWSPDDRYLAVLSSRNGASQVWLLDRRGGDAQQLTDFIQGVRSYGWSPDGTKMLLVVKDPSPADLDEVKRPNPRPYVIDRVQFKRDYVGYLDNRRTHVYVIDIADGKTRQVTSGDYDDMGPVWSPDGKHIVFVSNRTETPDRNRNTDLWRVDTGKNDPQPERLTNATYADSNPAWSPDGRLIAYNSYVSDGLPVYAIPQLSILDVETGKSAPVESLAEIRVYGFQFSNDGRSILAIAEYRGERQLIKIDVATGATARVIAGENTVREFDVSHDGQIYAVISRPQSPADMYRLDENGLQRLSAINRDLMAGITTGTVEKYSHEVEDGTVIDTFVMFPPDYEEGKRYPGIMRIHGGPWSQYDWHFNSEAQMLAAAGYVVVMTNFRGSFGYGQAFADALVGKWGDVDYRDSMDAMDFAIEKGWVDGDRMAVYGWSWGGFLTNHVITKTDRFKAAISGASETLVVANYGHDEWQRLWAEDPGLPWLDGNREVWDKVSPFYSLDKVTTPTLVVGGEDDWNMPILNSEQLYLVLKHRGVPTQLVVYPGEGHSISVPSYRKDLYERYLGWFEKYLGDSRL